MRLNANISLAGIFCITVLGFQMLMVYFCTHIIKKKKKETADFYYHVLHSSISLFIQPQSMKNISEMQINKLYWRLFYDPSPKSTEVYGNVLHSRRYMNSVFLVQCSFTLTNRAALQKNSRHSSFFFIFFFQDQ